jgi:replicative superfamily II helicase
MNTGNGKTLVGVMLLTGSLNKHAGPAAYLTPDPVHLMD